eukprot:TRINITY_DN46_c0_g1_i3.p2 TRINITY_DN46_c0_g1~~TRINITY_DN46_c0_g1_i3.p2  ORF type:complete len:122 (-),score=20.35 TRINITY_DN46_c0_g1_i3:115-480(-)
MDTGGPPTTEMATAKGIGDVTIVVMAVAVVVAEDIDTTGTTEDTIEDTIEAMTVTIEVTGTTEVTIGLLIGEAMTEEVMKGIEATTGTIPSLILPNVMRRELRIPNDELMMPTEVNLSLIH